MTKKKTQKAQPKKVKRTILVAHNALPAIEYDDGEFVRFDSFEEYHAALKEAE